MPLIEVHLIENVFDSAQKKQIIEKLTDAMVSIEGENMRNVTWVKLSEVASGEWGDRRSAANDRSGEGACRGQEGRLKSVVRPHRGGRELPRSGSNRTDSP